MPNKTYRIRMALYQSGPLEEEAILLASQKSGDFERGHPFIRRMIVQGLRFSQYLADNNEKIQELEEILSFQSEKHKIVIQLRFGFIPNSISFSYAERVIEKHKSIKTSLGRHYYLRFLFLHGFWFELNKFNSESNPIIDNYKHGLGATLPDSAALSNVLSRVADKEETVENFSEPFNSLDVKEKELGASDSEGSVDSVNAKTKLAGLMSFRQ